MKKNIESIIKYIIYITFFVPLVVVPSSFIFPFIVPKILLFRSLVIILLVGYSVLLYANWSQYKPKLTWVTAILLFFTISFGLSTFIGADPYHSFWDNHERMLGFFTILHFITYYFVCSISFKTWQDWQKAFKIFLIAGSLVMFVAVFQQFKPTFLLNQTPGRSASTLGNAIYVGGYGMFLFFVALLLFLKETVKSWKYIEIFLGFLAFLGMLFSQTRGTFVGLFIGLCFAVCGYAFFSRGNKKIRNFFILGFAACVVVGGVLFSFRKTVFVSRIPAVGRVLNTSFSDFKNSPRATAWRIGLEGSKERPIFGWGPNNFYFLFNKYYEPKLLESGYAETWFDNAHNIIVNTLAVQGIVGLISYVSIFVISVLCLIKNYRRSIIDKHILIIGSGFLIAHLIQNITVFENPTSYIYFIFWLAFINSITYKENIKLSSEQTVVVATKKNNTDKKIGKGIVSVSLVAGFVFIWITDVQPARANKKTFQAMRQLKLLSQQHYTNPKNQNTLVENVETTLKEVTAFSSPHIDDIRYDISRESLSFVSELIHPDIAADKRLDSTNAIKILNIVEQILLQNLKIHPRDIRIHLLLAQNKQMQSGLENNIESQKKSLENAEKYLEEALHFSPKRQQIMYSLAGIKFYLNKSDESIALLKKAISDNPHLGESYLRLAYTYTLLNKIPEAKQSIEEAKKQKINFNSQEQEVVNQIINLADVEITSSTSKNN